MRFDVLTLFPEMFEPIKQSIIGRAIEKKIVEINTIDIRDFSKDRYRHVDDTVYGGGAGMLLRPDVVYDAYKSVKSEKSKVIYLSPKGKRLDQKMVEDLAKEKHLILLCGHYEGIDQRAIDKIGCEEISVGDYVLTGGELPAMILIDSVSRYLDGVLTEGSTMEESFSNGLLEYPQYTRPEEFEGMKVPEVLQSGHHKNIETWRRKESLRITLRNRPDLLEKANLTEEDKKYLKELEEKLDD
jgi:tRNA (guanine37-N1)-methyltransferase